MFLAVLLDKEIRGSRFYQTALYIPVVLSLALVGFIWQLIYSPDQGLLNAITGGTTDWYGDPNINMWAVLVAVCWRQRLRDAALPGRAEGGRPDAARGRGGRRRAETQTFFRVVFPVLRPINIVVLVITFIESLRAFDIVWVVNKGRNGLELISALVTTNIVGEASRIGFGSALATIMLAISSVFVALYLRIALREEDHSMSTTVAPPRSSVASSPAPRRCPATERAGRSCCTASSSSRRCSGSSRSSMRC